MTRFKLSVFALIVGVALTGCRFEQAIDASLVTSAAAFAGDWKAVSGPGRVLATDLRHGRLRLLVRNEGQGLVLDGHIVSIEGVQLLQAQVLARLGSNGKPAALPTARWMIWRVTLNDKQLTTQLLNPISADRVAQHGFSAAVRLAIRGADAFSTKQKWQWVGSEQPAKL